MTPEQQAQAIAAELVRRQPWFARPWAYGVTLSLAIALPAVCPKLPPRAQLVCEYVHDFAHALVQGGPPASLATSSATPGAGADGG